MLQSTVPNVVVQKHEGSRPASTRSFNTQGYFCAVSTQDWKNVACSDESQFLLSSAHHGPLSDI